LAVEHYVLVGVIALYCAWSCGFATEAVHFMREKQNLGALFYHAGKGIRLYAFRSPWQMHISVGEQYFTARLSRVQTRRSLLYKF
ncbi:uncharacterized protein EV420DRAFT_1546422, partial [Desarmillaria tabescens]